MKVMNEELNKKIFPFTCIKYTNIKKDINSPQIDTIPIKMPARYFCNHR